MLCGTDFYISLHVQNKPLLLTAVKMLLFSSCSKVMQQLPTMCLSFVALRIMASFLLLFFLLRHSSHLCPSPPLSLPDIDRYIIGAVSSTCTLCARKHTPDSLDYGCGAVTHMGDGRVGVVGRGLTGRSRAVAQQTSGEMHWQ